VRYEYNGSLIALPYSQQLLLHQAPCPCVRKESAERNQEKRRTLPNAEKHHCERTHAVIGR